MFKLPSNTHDVSMCTVSDCTHARITSVWWQLTAHVSYFYHTYVYANLSYTLCCMLIYHVGYHIHACYHNHIMYVIIIVCILS